MNIDFTFSPANPATSEPAYQTEGASGFDIHADFAGELMLQPGDRFVMPTGISIAVPMGYELQIRPRSGRAAKEGLSVINTPGTIDSDYRGEVKVALVNLGHLPVLIVANDRVAQGVICPIIHAELNKTDTLPETQRSPAGFGSTGR